jgi:sugar lactone lactonase YvrE
MAMDKSKNLWITQSETSNNIKVLKPDGSWIVSPLITGIHLLGDMIISQNGYKWIIIPDGNGLLVCDDNNCKSITVKAESGEVISNIFSIAEDLEGNIWIGSDRGPLVYYNPEEILSKPLTASRPKIPRNDGSSIYDYALHTEAITSIAVDGADRKWLGTANTGVYLLSADGTSQIRNYTETNSPLFSNSIVSIAVDDNSGDVWFGTSKGIQSFRGDAIAGKERYENVYAFPNPVRGDFNGNVTITGLMSNSTVKITDVSGNLVFETKSLGGEASWDLTTYNGRRVTTGVYIAFCSSEDGKAACTVKILVMR